MADSIVRLKVESQEYDQKLKRATEGLTRYADECKKVGGTLEVVEKDTLEYVHALGQMDTVSRTATGKLAEMKKAFTELSVQYKQMTDAEKQSPFGKALAQSLDQLKGRINESKIELDDVNKSLNGGGGLSDALNAVAGKFGLNIDQLTKFGSVVGVATTALQVAKDAFFQTESGIDEWGRTVEGAKGAYNIFLDTLNNGNWSNFFQNLETAIRGGRDLYDVFDRLGSIKSNNAAAIALVQQQIAQLRLAKQQGENVDEQLKAATARLANLQSQSVNAGKAAGTQSAFNVIRNSVNSIGGAGVNDATINYAVQQIMKNGQSEFDKYRYNYQTLQRKGTRTTVTPIDDGMGGTVNKYSQTFDINNLTSEQQKQYALAKAITEGETSIQRGISAFAQAVGEGTASAREQFKGNRYALQGTGGGGGGKGFDIGKIAFSAKMVEPKEFIAPPSVWEKYADGIRGTFDAIDDSMSNLTEWTNDFDPYTQKMEEMTKAAMQQRAALTLAGQAVNSFSAALSGMEDPAAKAAGQVVSAIASIAMGFAMASSNPNTAGTGWGWLAWLAAGASAMATTIATIHSLTGYAQGGIVQGNSYSGDNMMFGGDGLYGLNSGELVLTKAQQGNLASQLSGGAQNLQLDGVISGENIHIVHSRYLKRTGQGELVTWR